MRGVSTVGHELFRGSMKHSDDPILLGIRFCEAVADSYRYGEQSGSPDDEVMLHLWVAGELLPNVDPSDAATWACLLEDLAGERLYNLTWEREERPEYHPPSERVAWRLWHQPTGCAKQVVLHFFIDTDDPALALVLARIQIREGKDR